MEDKESHYKYLRIRLPMFLYRKYRIVCAERNLSMNKQMAALVKEFIDNMSNYIKVLKKLEKED